MRQAIEEGFILDVLASYATCKAYWRLLNEIEDDPRYDKGKAEYLLNSFVDLHPHAIGEKIAICVEHFAAQAAGEIGGRAKAMIVTRSRLHAVRTKLALDSYLAEKGHPWKALVAFSGTVNDGGQTYTESAMNSAGLERQSGALDPAGSKPRGGGPDEELEALSRIIEALNERFGLNLGPEHRVTLDQIRAALHMDAGVDASARVNTRENVRLTFDPKVEDKIQEIVETNFDLYVRTGPGTVRLGDENAAKYVASRFGSK